MVEKADPENVGASVHARAGPGKPPGFVPAAPHSFAPLGLRRRGGLLPTAYAVGYIPAPPRG